MYPPQQHRPSGVSILAALYFIQGILAIAAGFYLGALFAGLDPTGGLALLCIGIFAIFGVIDFVIGYGLWTLQGWARTLAIIFAVINLINIPVGTIISIIVLWYLFKPEIKAAFGQGPPPMAYPPPMYGAPPAYPPPAAPPPAGGTTCRNCGSMIPAGTQFCPNCGARVG